MACENPSLDRKQLTSSFLILHTSRATSKKSSTTQQYMNASPLNEKRVERAALGCHAARALTNPSYSCSDCAGSSTHIV